MGKFECGIIKMQQFYNYKLPDVFISSVLLGF